MFWIIPTDQGTWLVDCTDCGHVREHDSPEDAAVDALTHTCARRQVA